VGKKDNACADFYEGFILGCDKSKTYLDQFCLEIETDTVSLK